MLKTLIATLVFLTLASVVTLAPAQQVDFKYKQAPIDNPLRGLVPYASQMPWCDPDLSEQDRKAYDLEYRKTVFPHSVEFQYFSMRELMTSENTFDWSPIEKWLDQAQRRGCQLTFRVFLEYPTQDVSIPQFLIDQGVKITEWDNNDKQHCFSPDYDNPKLRAAIKQLIQAMGKKYDGDPRVAFLTMGILGHWGEWHSYPRTELFPDQEYQAEVISLFQKSFSKTQVLMRYCAAENDYHYTKNSHLPFGYHDDSFAWATLTTGKEHDDWFFQTRIEAAGSEALNRWKTHSIGGEIRPEIWGCIFDSPSCEVKGQEFDKCVQGTHASWLMDSGMFQEKPSDARREQAIQSVSKMGYEFFVSSANVRRAHNGAFSKISLTNRGVAPFYHNWPIELAVIDNSGRILDSQTPDWNLTTVVPGSAVNWQTTISHKLKNNESIVMRVANPMAGGKSIRFANENQQLDGAGWLTLYRQSK